MSFFARLFKRLAPKSAGRSGAEGLGLLLASFTTGGDAGGKLAEVFNNMEDGGAENLAGYLSGMPDGKISQLARWIETASSSELAQAAKYIGKANVYQLSNLQDWLDNVRSSQSESRAERHTSVARRPTEEDRARSKKSETSPEPRTNGGTNLLIFRQSDSLPTDSKKYGKALARLCRGSTNGLGDIRVVKVRDGIRNASDSEALAYVMGLHARLLELEKVQDWGSSTDCWVGDDPDGCRAVVLMFCSTREVQSKSRKAVHVTKSSPDTHADSTKESRSTTMEIGEGVMIMHFPQASRSNYDNHLSLLRELHAKRVFPALRVYALTPNASMADTSRLIVITGSMSEAQKVSALYYTPEAESFVNSRLHGDWNAINASTTNDNVPTPGCRVDTQSFQRRLNEVVRGDYAIERIV